MLKPLIGILVTTLATPALSDEYWVQYDYSTHECSIVQSATHQTATRFPWSPPNDGSKPKGPLNGKTNGDAGVANAGATGNSSDSTASADGTKERGAPNTSNEASATNNSNAISNTANKAGPPSESNSTNDAGTTNNPANDFQSEMEAAWKRKAELAKENKIDVSKALVGSAMQTLEEAEDEMQIMRICGLRN